MGGGISSLPKSEQLKISNHIRLEYENLVKEHPENQAQIQSKLIEKYNLHVNEKTSAHITNLSPSKGINQNGLIIKSPGGIKASPVKKKGSFRTRRKSFENIKQIAKSPEDVVLVAEEKDVWDSVSQQPYCKICSMAFKSHVFLDRHNKYSEFHARSAMKRTPVEAPIEPLHVQENHFKLMYNGSKLFWRSRETVDIFLYSHIELKCIEIIMFDEAGRELTRLYIDYDLVTSVIQSELDTEVTAAWDAEVERSTQALDDIKLTKDEIREELKRTLITTYIIHRLQQEAIKEGETNSFRNVIYVLSETSTVDPTIPKPAALIEVVVKRRRKSNADEINKVIKDLESNLDQLNTIIVEKLEHEIDDLNPFVINYESSGNKKKFNF